jgi:hypothetical protein
MTATGASEVEVLVAEFSGIAISSGARALPEVVGAGDVRFAGLGDGLMESEEVVVLLLVSDEG